MLPHGPHGAQDGAESRQADGHGADAFHLARSLHAGDTKSMEKYIQKQELFLVNTTAYIIYAVYHIYINTISRYNA